MRSKFERRGRREEGQLPSMHAMSAANCQVCPAPCPIRQLHPAPPIMAPDHGAPNNPHSIGPHVPCTGAERGGRPGGAAPAHPSCSSTSPRWAPTYPLRRAPCLPHGLQLLVVCSGISTCRWCGEERKKNEDKGEKRLNLCWHERAPPHTCVHGERKLGRRECCSRVPLRRNGKD